MNEGLPVNSTRKRTNEEAPMESIEFTLENIARATSIVERDLPIARILQRYLISMINCTRDILKEGGYTPETLTKTVLDKAITAAFKQHKCILPPRRDLYRQALEILFEKEPAKSQHSGKRKISPIERLEMLNTERQRHGDPVD